MGIKNTPLYQDGVALTREGDTWFVVTVDDVVGYPTYWDALIGYRLTVRDINA